MQIYKAQKVSYDELLADGWIRYKNQHPPESQEIVWYEVIYSEQMVFNEAKLYYSTAGWWLNDWYCFTGVVQYWRPKDE